MTKPTLSLLERDKELTALSEILKAMSFEGGGYNLDTLYTEDQADGAAFVNRAADLLLEWLAETEAAIAAEHSKEQASGEERSAESWASLFVPPLGYMLVKEQTKPHQEPVAWLRIARISDKVTGVFLTQDVELRSEFLRPLYTSPQVLELARDTTRLDYLLWVISGREFKRVGIIYSDGDDIRKAIDNARAIEAHHNIGVKK